MNYYEEILNEIEENIDNGQFLDAERLIRNELSVSYIPRDVERKLNEYLSRIRRDSFEKRSLSDEQIEDYLQKDEIHQLMAVDELNKKNLRNYVDTVQSYLSGDGYLNGKVLLIDSLIRQEINCDFIYNGKTFNPSKIIVPEKSEGFLSALELIRERFMKDPSMMAMAEQLLYKEALMALPETLNKEEGIAIADKIIVYILNAFESAN